MKLIVIVCVLYFDVSSSFNEATFLGMTLPDNCTKGETCAGRCGELPGHTDDLNIRRSCHCDDLCPIYGDCCFDFFNTCENLKRYEDVVDYLHGVRDTYGVPPDTYNDVTRSAHHSSCRTVNNGSTIISIYMIDECPGDIEDGLKTKCELKSSNVLSNVPVTNRWNMNEVYANLFCALCHGIHTSDMIVWDSRLFCDTPLSDKSMIIHNLEIPLSYCKVTVTYDTASRFRACDPRLLTPKCHHSSKESDDKSSYEDNLLCHAYKLPVQHQGIRYSNPHCVTCEVEKGSNSEFKCVNQKRPDTKNRHNFMDYYTPYDVDISLHEMTYSLQGGNSVVITPGMMCPDGLHHNMILNKCENKSVCPDDSLRMERGECFRIYQTQNKTGVNAASLFLKMKFDVFSKPNFTNAVTNLESSIYNVLQNTLRVHGFDSGKTSVHVSSIREFINWNKILQGYKDMSIPVSHITYESTLNVDTEETLSHILTIIQISYLQFSEYTDHTVYPVEMIISNKKDMSMDCESRKATFKTVGLYRKEEHMYAKFGSTKTLVDIEDGAFSIVLTDQYGVMHLQTFVLCISESDEEFFRGHGIVQELPCKAVTFKETEYSIEDEGLHLLETDLTIPEKSYVLNKRVASVCQNTLKDLFRKRDIHPALFIYKGVMLSICASCMLIVIIVKTKNRILLDTDGKLLLGEICCLMVVFIIDIFASFLQSEHARIFLSAVTHLLWLLTFCIHGVRASCIIKETHKSYINAPVKEKFSKKRFLYCLIGVSTVAVVSMVVVSLTLDKHHPSVHIGYGHGTVIWWMGNSVALLVTFGIPSGIAIFVSFWCLLYDLWYGRKARTTWMSRHRSVTSFCVSVMFFITLCFGLSGEFSGLQVLGYLYYTAHVILSLFVLYTMVITDLVIQSYMQRMEFDEPVKIITQKNNCDWNY